jgi:sugar phosphate isomerase/epimerase
MTTSRREFLVGGARAAVGLGVFSAFGPSALSAADSPAKKKMRFGFCTYQWGKDWDVPTLIANCQKAGVYGVEPRVGMKYAHGMELTLNTAHRAEIKKRFADSPVRIVSIATGERLDWVEPEKLRAAVEAVKAYLQLSREIGCNVLRVFANQFHPNVPHEKTIEQIARSLNELAGTAANLGQEVSLEAYGSAGELPTMRAVMDRVSHRNVRVRLNSLPSDNHGRGFAENFRLVKDFLSSILHVHDLTDPEYPYQLLVNLLVQSKWEGWALLERKDRFADRVAAMADQRLLWQSMIDRAVRAN